MEKGPVGQISDDEKLKIINNLASAVHAVYVSPKKLYLRSFLSGVFSGLGATIGVAVIVAIIGVLIRHFGGLPVVGQWLIDIGKILPTKR